MIVIYNPTAGRRRIASLWRVMDVLIANGLRPQIAETQSRGHATALAREAVSNGERLVVAAGGDGTIAEVAAGLIGTAASLGIIPLGTANVLAHELALPFDARALGRDPRLRPHPPALARHRRERRGRAPVRADARRGARCAGGAPGERAAQARDRAPGLRAADAARDRPLRLRADPRDDRRRATEAASVVVSKGRLYGGNYTIAPDARDSPSPASRWRCSATPARAPHSATARRWHSTGCRGSRASR